MTGIEELNADLRRAVASGQYQKVHALLGRYEPELRRLAGRAPRDRRTMEAVRSVLALLAWARRALRAGRAHEAAGMARCRAARTYGEPVRRPASSLQVEG